MPQRPVVRKTNTIERRAEMVRMYRRGFTQIEIAAHFKVDQTYVASELKSLREEWQKDAVTNVSEIVQEELSKIKEIEKEAWLAWERSCSPAVQRTKKIEKRTVTVSQEQEHENGEVTVTKHHELAPFKQHLEKLKKERDGNPAFLDKVAWCVEMRLKIFGVLKEYKVENNVSLNFDSLIDSVPDIEDLAEQKILEIQASAVVQEESSPKRKKHGTNGDGHDTA